MVVEWFEGNESRQCLICSTFKVVSCSNKRDVDVNKNSHRSSRKGMCQTSSKAFWSFKETYVHVRHRKRYKIVGLNRYKYLYIYVYDHTGSVGGQAINS